jgi:TonB-dependent SusC/RagA subfamily outer membrane receptor
MPHFFIYLLKVNLALIAFYLLYYFALRRLTFYTLNRWYLLASIFIASAFPLVQVEKLFTNIKNSSANNVVFNYAPNWNQVKLVIVNTESSFTLWSILYFVYWLGVIAMVILFLVQIFSLISIHISATKNKYSVWTTNLDIQPLSFFKNIYINPIKHTSQELQTILQHEKVHTSQWHTLDLILAEVNKIVYWFNPGVWLLKNAIRENLEFIADKKVLESGKDAQQYQYELLHVITGAHKATAIATQFSLLHLKNRITMMNKQKSSRWNKTKYLLLIPILCVVAVVVAQRNNKKMGHGEPKTPKLSITKQNDLEDFVRRHKKIKTATWGYIDHIVSDDIDFKDKVTEGPLLSITFKNEKFEMYQYNLKKDREKFKANYGEEMPTPSNEAMQKLSHPNVQSNVENDYQIEVKTINGATFAIAYDKNWREVSRIKLGGSNSKAIKKWEGKYGKIPPPPPPLTGASAVFNGKATLPSVLPTDAIKDSEVVVVGKKLTGNISNATIGFKPNDAIAKLYDKPNFTINNKNGQQPLFVIDGKITPLQELNNFDANQIQHIHVLKDSTAKLLYGEQGKNGVVLVKTKKMNKIFSDSNPIRLIDKEKERPLYVLNDVMTSKQKVESINPNDIESVNVLKGSSATQLYGAWGGYGVIVVKTKENKIETSIPIVKHLKDNTNSTFWIGVDNPIEIKFNNNICNPTVSITNGDIVGANGSYIVRVNTVGFATIVLEMDGKKYKYVYNVKKLPPAEVKVAG